MTLTQKKRFVKELIENIHSELKEKMPRVPEEWDGHELRVWIADRFEEAAKMSCIREDKRGSRRREYKNDVLVMNL